MAAAGLRAEAPSAAVRARATPRFSARWHCHGRERKKTERKHTMKKMKKLLHCGAVAVLVAQLASPALASSHMDAPLITLDPAANTTDVYAFVVTRNGVKYLDVALGVYPHEEPGVGPNKYAFDPNVLYQLFLADPTTGADRVAYQFQFADTFGTQATILQ